MGPHGAPGLGEAFGSPHAGRMSFQAAEKLGPTQIVKILIQETPDIFLAQGSATAVQLIALELFATNEVSRPFFTLGIVSSIVCDIGNNLFIVPVQPYCFAKCLYRSCYPAEMGEGEL